MIVALVRELRARGVPVGLTETVALGRALALGLHESSLDEFYRVARALLVHDESKLDDFDQVFSHVFRDVPYSSRRITEELRDWLSSPKPRPEDEAGDSPREMSEDEIAALLRELEERLQEQTERHDGGSYWVGTGGRSPFGTGGVHPAGVSLRSGPPASGATGGGRSVLRSADARRYRGYREDVVLDVRQTEAALRKLRALDRLDGRRELDLAATIDATARNFGDLELVMARPRRPNTRVILMMDVGGSMDPHAALVSRLFSAAKRATHWKELRTYYFHNCPYGRVYRTDGLREALPLGQLFRECDRRYKLVFVGDASMAPYELGMDDSFFSQEGKPRSGLQWLLELHRQYPDSIWLNPDSGSRWPGSTVETISRVFPMFPLTIAGLQEGLGRLNHARA